MRPRRYFDGIACSTTPASSAEVSIGFVSRRATIACAILRANRSSPYPFSTAAISSSRQLCTMSAAVKGYVAGSPNVTRSGSSALKENPLPPPSSRLLPNCSLRQPRSATIASALARPCVLAISEMFLKLPVAKSTRAYCVSFCAISCATRATAIGSASTPSTVPCNPSFTRMAEKCPPLPSVASMTVASGASASPSTVSRQSTGVWRLFPSSILLQNSHLAQLLRKRIPLLFNLALVLRPLLLVPNLHAVVDASEHHFTPEPREILEEIRDKNASGAVDLRLDCARKKEAVESSCVRLSKRQSPNFPRDIPPRFERIDEEAVVEAPRHHYRFAEFAPPFSWHRQAFLRVKGMCIFANQHKKCLRRV